MKRDPARAISKSTARSLSKPTCSMDDMRGLANPDNVGVGIPTTLNQRQDQQARHEHGASNQEWPRPG
jgi:hypothetical protein